MPAKQKNKQSIREMVEGDDLLVNDEVVCEEDKKMKFVSFQKKVKRGRPKLKVDFVIASKLDIFLTSCMLYDFR